VTRLADGGKFTGFAQLGSVKIPPHLKIEPELRRDAKEPRQPQRRARRNPALLVNEFVNALIGHPDRIRELTLTDLKGLKKLRPEHFARMGGLPVAWNADHEIFS